MSPDKKGGIDKTKVFIAVLLVAAGAVGGQALLGIPAALNMPPGVEGQNYQPDQSATEGPITLMNEYPVTPRTEAVADLTQIQIGGTVYPVMTVDNLNSVVPDGQTITVFLDSQRDWSVERICNQKGMPDVCLLEGELRSDGNSALLHEHDDIFGLSAQDVSNDDLYGVVRDGDNTIYVRKDNEKELMDDLSN